MAAPRRSEIQMNKDREEIVGLVLQGVTQREIAKRIGLSPGMISYDLKAIQEQWKQSTIEDMNQLKAKELAKIEYREKEAWEAWYKSKEETKKQTKITKKGDVQTIETIETKCGDPRYLEAIAKCSKDRRELLGMDAPSRSEVAAVVVSAKLPDGLDPSSV